MEDIIPQINAWFLIALGIILMGFEMMTMVLVLIFFGFAFVVVGFASFYIEMSGEVQILTAIVLGGLLMLLLRKHILKIMKADDLALETLTVGEVGVLSEHNGDLRVNYKGTTWAIETGQVELSFTNGEKVLVTSLENNVATISKL